MAKQIQATLLCLILTAIAVAAARGVSQSREAVDEWFRNLGRANEKITKLHFYFHDTISGKSPSAVTVAQGSTTFTSSPTLFGLVKMADDPLTVAPEPTSAVLGRAQGFYGSADQNEVGLVMYMNFHFTAGKYKGSSLSLLGRNAAFHNIREMSIVGGTGVFRLARGIATAKTYSLNATTIDAIVEYNVVVVHY